MYNIWGFLLQTISVSIVAALILLLKHVFEDKLSPRWQYSVWILLAVRILVPVNLAQYIIPHFALWLEILKGVLEKRIDSNYSQIYEPITLHHVFPVITQEPKSITDWLFIIYTVGIIFCLFRYLLAYIRLRILLKSALSVSDMLEQKMLAVCEKYHLKPCKMIAVEGFSSAFLCGVFRPVLVVPAKNDINEKILLHELLHLKHHDTIQNIGWCILRSLQWCNPLVQYAINQIENDMESLCDQRVLELLEGEERREYGVILLDMASKRYARIPGTSSISNGSKNISQRIASIVRFKKYPQGMALVSICIILVLFRPTIIGSAHTFTQSDYTNYSSDFDNVMAVARINRCNSVAGALDTYAKGLYLYNGIYIASASSLSDHERIQNELEEYGCYQSGKYFVNIETLYDYYIYNVDQRTETEYTATLCYYASMYIDEYVPELLECKDEENEIYSCDAYVFVPVSIKKEDAWVVKETDERYIISYKEYTEKHPAVLCGKEYYGKNDIGEVLLEVETKYTINNTIQNNNMFWDTTQFDTSPKPNAIFDYYELNKHIVYTHTSDERPRSYVELNIKEQETDDYFKSDEVDFTIEEHGENGWTIYEETTDWDGTVEDVAGGGYGGYEVEIIDMPSSYFLQLKIDASETDNFILQEVAE